MKPQPVAKTMSAELHRSAGFQPAVSQNCILRAREIFEMREPASALPVANRRYSRLQICATALVAALLLAGTSSSLATIKVAPASSVPSTAPATPAAPNSAASIANEDIHDIRGPYHIPPGWLWPAWVAGGLALAGLGYGAWRWRHRLGIRVKLPYEIALEQLEAARRLMQPEQARAFSIAVSEIVRDYIETRFAVRAAHRTTEEFFRDLATLPDSPLATHQPVLADFLKHCDLAKFARWILSVPQMEAMLQSATNFIVATGKPASDISPTPTADKSVSPPAPGAPSGAPASFPAKSNAASADTTLFRKNPVSTGSRNARSCDALVAEGAGDASSPLRKPTTLNPQSL
jgi:hypothetical protein